MGRKKKWALGSVVVMASTFLSVVAAEFSLRGAVWALSLWPGLFSPESSHLLRNLYLEGRNIVQYQRESVQFDEVLSYRLRPGISIFRNIEFSTTLEVNSEGLRDDEDSLNHPQIISLGDSFAMGWGVEQENTYSQRLEWLTGMKVLNAGISSYGTAREMKLLGELHTESVKWLLVQYCRNDWLENGIFKKRKQIRPWRLKELQQHFKTGMRSFFPFLYGAYALTPYSPSYQRAAHYRKVHKREIALAQSELRRKMERRGIRINKDNPLLHEQRDFLFALERGLENLPRTARVLIFSLDGAGGNDDRFIKGLKKLIPNKPYASRIELLETGKVNYRDHYFTVDDHMNKKGHAFVARLIAEKIMGSHWALHE